MPSDATNNIKCEMTIDEEVISNIVGILVVECQNGLSSDQIQSELQSIGAAPINSQKYGFKSLDQLLSSPQMQNHITWHKKDNTYRFFPKTNQNTGHLCALIQNQSKSKGKKNRSKKINENKPKAPPQKPTNKLISQKKAVPKPLPANTKNSSQLIKQQSHPNIMAGAKQISHPSKLKSAPSNVQSQPQAVRTVFYGESRGQNLANMASRFLKSVDINNQNNQLGSYGEPHADNVHLRARNTNASNSRPHSYQVKDLLATHINLKKQSNAAKSQPIPQASFKKSSSRNQEDIRITNRVESAPQKPKDPKESNSDLNRANSWFYTSEDYESFSGKKSDSQVKLQKNQSSNQAAVTDENVNPNVTYFQTKTAQPQSLESKTTSSDIIDPRSNNEEEKNQISQKIVNNSSNKFGTNGIAGENNDDDDEEDELWQRHIKPPQKESTSAKSLPKLLLTSAKSQSVGASPQSLLDVECMINKVAIIRHCNKLYAEYESVNINILNGQYPDLHSLIQELQHRLEYKFIELPQSQDTVMQSMSTNNNCDTMARLITIESLYLILLCLPQVNQSQFYELADFIENNYVDTGNELNGDPERRIKRIPIDSDCVNIEQSGGQEFTAKECEYLLKCIEASTTNLQQSCSASELSLRNKIVFKLKNIAGIS